MTTECPWRHQILPRVNLLSNRTLKENEDTRVVSQVVNGFLREVTMSFVITKEYIQDTRDLQVLLVITLLQEVLFPPTFPTTATATP